MFNVFLQILDDGRVTDSQGHVVDFKNTIIIMTSNVGSQHVLEGQGENDTSSGQRDTSANHQEKRTLPGNHEGAGKEEGGREGGMDGEAPAHARERRARRPPCG